MLRPDGCMNMVEFDENTCFYILSERKCLRESRVPGSWYFVYDANTDHYKAFPKFFFKYNADTCEYVRGCVRDTECDDDSLYFLYNFDVSKWVLASEGDYECADEISDITDSDDSEYEVSDDDDDDNEDNTDYSDIEFGVRHETIGIL